MDSRSINDGQERMKPSGRWGIFLIAGLFISLIFAYFVIHEEKSRAQGDDRTIPTVGKSLVDIDLPDLDGTVHTISDYHGKPLVINFWGTWCKNCREEMSLFETYSNEYSDDYVMLAINTLDSRDTIDSFLSEYGITFNIVTDPDGSICDFYYVSGFPTTFFIDSEGILQAKQVGSLTERQLIKYLETIDVDVD